MVDDTYDAIMEAILGEQYMTTAAQEAIRIAETYLPRGSVRRKQELAQEIVDAINLCEAESTNEIVKALEKLAAQI